MLAKNSMIFRDPQNVSPELCHSPAMFKYTDKQQLLTLYIHCDSTIAKRSSQVAKKPFH